MKKFLKALLGVYIFFSIGIGLFVLIFFLEMSPDKDEEEKVKAKAEQYLKQNFNGSFEIYDVLFDNMGNFEAEYSAKVREKEHNTEFLVYYDETTKQMADTYIADKWRDDVEREIRPYIKENFGESTDFFVLYDATIGKELGLDFAHSGNYKDFKAVPTIRITLPRKKIEDDEKLFNEFISYLKNEVELQKGSVVVEYVAKSGEILEEDEWIKEF